MFTKHLADDPPDAIATHGVADGAGAHRHAESGEAQAVREGIHREESIARSLATLVDALEVGRAVEPVTRSEAVRVGHGEPGIGAARGRLGGRA